jgi:heterodisulfide reductase subunit B
MTEEIASDVEPIEINDDLARLVLEETGENVHLCYQCSKCSSGCPVSAFFDWQPNQIMRAVQLGQEEIAFDSDTPWLCASCQTCTTRCPQGLDICAIMEFLTREAVKRGNEPRIPEVQVFNEAFLREVRLWNRSYEPGLMAEMKLRLPSHLFDDLDFYVRMLQKGKVGFFPHPVRKPSKVKRVPGATDMVAYYPGCSLDTTAKEYDISARAVCEALDLELYEPGDWVCCGSSAAHRADPVQALQLPMINLSMMERMGFQEVTMPCAACYSRHKFAQHEVRHDAEKRTAVEHELGQAYQDRLAVNTLIETMHNRVGTEKIKARVKRPLDGLPVVCYYGCLLTRPPEVTHAAHPENPTNMDEIMKALGAKVIDWSYKTNCCGAAHSLTRPDIVLELSGNLVEHARESGAEAIAVACPLCHTNLDARQFQMDLGESIPVLYFTQFMALAFDLPLRQVALHKNLVDPMPLLRRRGLLPDGHPAIPAEAEEGETEDESAHPRIRARAPPLSAPGGTRRVEVYEDIFDVLRQTWKAVSRHYDVMDEAPALMLLFNSVDFISTRTAAEKVVANMLIEITERVDRFSPWYCEPAHAYGLISYEDPVTNCVEWGLSAQGKQQWQSVIEELTAGIRRDYALLLANLTVNRAEQNDHKGKREFVRLFCECDPPRSILVPEKRLTEHEIICDHCGAPFRKSC